MAFRYLACSWSTRWYKIMSLYSKGIYPQLTEEERVNKTILARTYDALIQALTLRDNSLSPIPRRLADDTEQKSMNWFLG